MVVKTYGSALQGIEAFPIAVEVSVDQGVGIFLVGLPDNIVKESLMRMETAIKSIGLRMPRTKVVINLAPADITKSGAGLDLPLTLGVLAASGQIKNPERLKDFIMMGELGLDGAMQPISGALSIAILARSKKLKGLILPQENRHEAALVNNINVYGMSHLNEVVTFFNSAEALPEASAVTTRENFFNSHLKFDEDFCDVKGQENMKRVLEIAAAGGHNVLFIGPPGSSKTMLARRMPTILPPLTLHESLETTRLYSIAGQLKNKQGLMIHRPFRAPHHTISDTALVGGGTIPRPGEISLAHNGLLFLDELPEFKRAALEALRQPLEERTVTISRAKITLNFPSSFMLIASMNPCPCGYYTHEERKCTCSQQAVQKYLARISGPLLDRIDLQLKVSPVPFYELDCAKTGETSAVICGRVVKAREVQQHRNKTDLGPTINANLTSKQIREHCSLEESSKKLLYKSMASLQLSARAYERILKVCRTIADLAGCESIKMDHVAEAVHYRSLDLQHTHKEPVKVKKQEQLSYEDRMYLKRVL